MENERGWIQNISLAISLSSDIIVTLQCGVRNSGGGHLFIKKRFS